MLLIAKQSVVAIDFHSISPPMATFNYLDTSIPKNVFDLLWKKFIQVWNNIQVSKWWQNTHFEVNYAFKLQNGLKTPKKYHKIEKEKILTLLTEKSSLPTTFCKTSPFVFCWRFVTTLRWINDFRFVFLVRYPFKFYIMLMWSERERDRKSSGSFPVLWDALVCHSEGYEQIDREAERARVWETADSHWVNESSGGAAENPRCG